MSKLSEYDLQHAAERIRSTGYPDALDFATAMFLHPPSEEEMLLKFP